MASFYCRRRTQTARLYHPAGGEKRSTAGALCRAAYAG